MAQNDCLFGRISSFVAAGIFFAAGIIVGLIPYSEGGYSGLCPSALQSLTGGTSTGQSWVNMLSGGRCTTYTNTMTLIMSVLFIIAVIALVAAILLRRRRSAEAGYGPDSAAGAPATPGYAPGYVSADGQAAAGSEISPYGGPGYTAQDETWRPPADYQAPTVQAPAAPGSGFDSRLLIAAVIAVAGIVLVFFAVQALSFLPGIVQLLIWTAVGLTVIWQLKRPQRWS